MKVPAPAITLSWSTACFDYSKRYIQQEHLPDGVISMHLDSVIGHTHRLYMRNANMSHETACFKLHCDLHVPGPSVASGELNHVPHP